MVLPNPTGTVLPALEMPALIVCAAALALDATAVLSMLAVLPVPAMLLVLAVFTLPALTVLFVLPVLFVLEMPAMLLVPKTSSMFDSLSAIVVFLSPSLSVSPISLVKLEMISLC